MARRVARFLALVVGIHPPQEVRLPLVSTGLGLAFFAELFTTRLAIYRLERPLVAVTRTSQKYSSRRNPLSILVCDAHGQLLIPQQFNPHDEALYIDILPRTHDSHRRG